MQFVGVVTSGLEEGAIYVEKYNKYFRATLGKEFFPGTLNVKTKEVIPLSQGTEVQPDEQGLQEVHCYPAKINDVAAFIVVPSVRKHREDIVEILATENLREKFRLKDGDEVTCELA